MTIWMILAAALALLTLALWAFWPAPGAEARRRMEPFSGLRYAHRGLHNLEAGVPENSLAAFAGAVERGFGIELDIHLTADGQVVVYHDDNLLRGCGVDRAIADCTYPELEGYSLFGTSHKIPLFSQALALVDGKVPLIVELKYQPEYPRLCAAAMALLAQYQGLYCIESFHPGVVRWFYKNQPEICRGFLSMDYVRDGKSRLDPSLFLCKNLLTNGSCKPHFIAYCEADQDAGAYRRCRRWFGTPGVAWTVRSQQREQQLYNDYEAVIFEHYLPGSPRLPAAGAGEQQPGI